MRASPLLSICGTPNAARRIHDAVPDARLVAVLREPTMRAYSNWADLRAQGREKLSFDDGIAAEDDRARQGLGAVLVLPVARALRGTADPPL